MSDLFSRAMVKGDPWEEAKKAIEHLREPFPHLWSVLAGCSAKDLGVDRMPGSVRLFTNGGELKCEITGPEWVMKGYLLMPKEVKFYEAVEGELSSQRIGWSVKTERPDSLRKPAY